MAFFSIDQVLKALLVLICYFHFVCESISLVVKQDFKTVDLFDEAWLRIKLLPDASKNKAYDHQGETCGNEDLLPDLERSALPKLLVLNEEVHRSISPKLVDSLIIITKVTLVSVFDNE